MLTDPKGNLYFTVYNNYVGQTNIVKVNTSNPDRMTYEKLSPDHHKPTKFLIDKDNNLFYSETDGNQLTETVYILSQGVVYKIQTDTWWQGRDNYCYSYTFTNPLNPNDETSGYIYKVFIKDKELTYEYFCQNENYWNTLNGGGVYHINHQIYIVGFDNIDRQCTVYNITDQEQLSTATYPLTDEFFADYSDSKYIYSLSKDRNFYRFDPTNGEFKKLYTPNNDYEIYGDIKVFNGIITFTAFQLSQNKNVLVEINSSDGNLTTTELASNNQCTILQKIK